MKKTAAIALLGMLTLGFSAPQALAHCQMPCGIYDDEARFRAMDEDLVTIEKAMRQIQDLAQHAANGEVPNVNQMVRWVLTKEKHVDEFSETVTYYFMTQRVKPADPQDRAAYKKYVKQVTLLHQMLVEAMKAKQTTDLGHVEQLRKLLAEFKSVYGN